MKNLYFLKDENLSLLELMEDSLFYKIPREKVKYYIDESIKIGKNVAKEYNCKDIESLLKENGVVVLLKESCGTKNIDIRGEIIFDKEEKQIIIYKNSIEQIIETLKKHGLIITKKQVYNIHLAHEFYHFLEYSNNEATNYKLDKIEIILGGFIKRKYTILKTREIAAHAFCKEILNLKFHPKLLDYIYLVENQKINIVELKKRIKELEENYIDNIA
ncbi:MAG: hypothetical protein HUJ77_12170 [Clostridium sp.]|uniref:hypothetical protein n=1 Tax=Clostridium sp. TaxID=1506 RepID=UPI0025B89EF5|nr:hypothetical protein [Clostridium sp.]MCF0149137.1 hypothetical protein [Clostridium sp.]